MNFKLILILALGLLIFTSIILFAVITYKTKIEKTDKGETIFKNLYSLYYGNIGVLIVMLLIDGILFIKR